MGVAATGIGFSAAGGLGRCTEPQLVENVQGDWLAAEPSSESLATSEAAANAAEASLWSLQCMRSATEPCRLLGHSFSERPLFCLRAELNRLHVPQGA